MTIPWLLALVVIFTTTIPDPTVYAGLVEWYRAQGMGSVTGDPILLTDLSGSGNHTTQTTSSQRPTYLQNAINGLAAARFTKTSNQVLHHPYNGEPATVCAVVRNRVHQQAGGYYGADTADAIAGGAYGLYINDGVLVTSTFRGRNTVYRATSSDTDLSTIDNGVRVSTPTGGFGMWLILCTTYDASTKTITHWVNGAKVGTSTTTHTARAIEAGTGLVGATVYNDVPQYGDVDLAELFAYSQVRSDAEVVKLSAYLAVRYLPADPSPGTYLFASFRTLLQNPSSEVADSDIAWLLYCNSDGVTCHETATTTSVVPKVGGWRDGQIIRWPASTGDYWWVAALIDQVDCGDHVSLARSSTRDGPYRWVADIDGSAVANGACPGAWAPTFVVDPADSKLKLAMALGPDMASDNLRSGAITTYIMEPTSQTDLSVGWGAPQRMVGIQEADPSVQAPYVVPNGGNYYAFVSRHALTPSSTGFIEVSIYKSTTTITGTYSLLHALITELNSCYEGNNILQVGSTWRLYVDGLGNCPVGEVLFTMPVSANDWRNATTTEVWTGPTAMTVSGSSDVPRNGVVIVTP